MWICSTAGFFSAVQHRDDPDQLMVRARSRVDLVNLIALAAGTLVPGPEIVETLDDADYPYRLTITKTQWHHLLGLLVDDIDYPNFKDAVARTNRPRALTYHDVWATLHRIEREPGAVPASLPEPKRASVVPLARNKRGSRR